MLGEAGDGQIAAADKARHRVIRVLTVAQIEFGVERVAQMEAHHHLLGFQHLAEAAQIGLVAVGGCAVGQLVAELFGHPPPQFDRRRLIHAVGTAQTEERP